MSRDYYGPIIDQMSPEAIAANGGRAAMIRKWKRKDRINRLVGVIRRFFNMILWLIKGIILIMTFLYFVNALFF